MVKFGGTEYHKNKVHVKSAETGIRFCSCFEMLGHWNQVIDERFSNVREFMGYVNEHKINLYRFETVNFGNENINMKFLPFSKLHCLVVEHQNFGNKNYLGFRKYFT